MEQGLGVANVNDLLIGEGGRKFHWPQVPRPADHTQVSRNLACNGWVEPPRRT